MHVHDSKNAETKGCNATDVFLAASVTHPFLEDLSVHTVRVVHGDPRGKRGLRLWSLRCGKILLLPTWAHLRAQHNWSAN